MFPRMCFSFDRLLHRKKKDAHKTITEEVSTEDLHYHSVLCNRKPTMSNTRLQLQCDKRYRNEEIKERKREMAHKVANISDLIHRVTSSCLTHPLAGSMQNVHDPISEEEEEDNKEDVLHSWEEETNNHGVTLIQRVNEMESLMAEVFNSVSAVKKAYVKLQEAHCPWDPDKMRVSDTAVVAELRRLGRLRDRFRRGGSGGGGGRGVAAPLREIVAPYEAALEDLRKELKAKEAEVDSLKEKVSSSTPKGSGRKGRMYGSKRVGCISNQGSPAAPTSELFETFMEEVKSASKSFTTHLLSLMRSARWDIAAAVRSIIDNSTDNTCTIPDVDPHHAKHALESYVTRKIFQGFENETFYIDGSLSSLLNPSEYRRECFAQFRDMRAMDPAEILGILPSCQFGRFSGKKYLAIVHPKMEESLFGGVEQRRMVLGGNHPRTGFYGEFLRLAKAVWLLHLLAFALEPSPSHFEASNGAEFHGEYMESVVRFGGGRVPSGFVVGFSVAPGFKLGNGSVVRARVYLVPAVREV